MKTIETIRRSAVQLAPDATVRDAAKLMEASGVGAVGIVDGDQLVGVVTDRDLVRRVLARDLPMDSRIDSVMSCPAVTIAATADLHDSYAMFRTHGLRRLAVLDAGRFVGMVTIDDLLIDLAADLSDLSRPVIGEVVFGQHDSSVPATS